ncbi:MAG TPA: Hsp70 family protein [Polyangiaceae bacterium LLY-WYZ-15_(1-7)]|nr:nucleotide-binding protein [Myxococcales bacterium]MAT23960.1 nucleotide-binding protein [Sandaracinus sp.]HJL05607.1 Hsp70 family protein [Polyangiaceae bacterium LLY-WYZ-15_(1-7)]MBJ71618.1 nucleotide-binding protein [Sandaracinus sp.]HJL06929.1 Hsp70 family protein [Polyangiaceae bacterium LLY-WYZ-15_(1-7)]
MSQYTLGVDLGTTHCALSYVDLDLSEGEEVAQHVLAIPQAVAPGEVEAKPLLPSFLYLPHPQELEPGAAALPWNPTPAHVVGQIARSLGAKTPIRLVSSAKSWLCHPGVDRKGPILPTDAPEEVQRMSPFAASVQYLAHLREAWDAKHPEAPFAEQEVVLTVPASFDPAARELTAEAAKAAGYAKLTLLEEPQAALYAWIQQTDGAWREQVEVGDVILVVDVGGGTSDFSLIAVLEEEGALQLRRVAVGEHILLGGDNMDLALAYTVKAKLEGQGKKLDAWQLRALTHGCRQAKEALLAGEKESVPLVVPSRGRKLIGGSLRTELTVDEVRAVLLDGFFPEVEVTAKPASRARGALTQLGLPYAQDAAVTRHLAAFLAKQVDAVADLPGFEAKEGARFLHPTAILFNGGVLKAPAIAERVEGVIQQWLESDGAPAARVLEGADLDRAVARGAAYYGYARQGGGVRIRGGMAQAFYVGVEAAMPAVPGMEPPIQALCVAPFGLEEGAAAEAPPQELGLVVGEPVRFRFFGSSVRRDDPSGHVLERWGEDELVELGQIEAELPAEGATPGEVVPVRLRARVSELGTLVLEALPRAGEHVWKVELNVRE